MIINTHARFCFPNLSLPVQSPFWITSFPQILQRHYVITRSPSLGGVEAMRGSEVSYTIKAILANPANESSWRYLKALYKDDKKSWISDPNVSSVCLNVLSRTDCFHGFALSTLLDLLCDGLRPTNEHRDSVKALANEETDTNLANLVCTILGRVDPIRANYWAWRKSKITVAIWWPKSQKKNFFICTTLFMNHIKPISNFSVSPSFDISERLSQ